VQHGSKFAIVQSQPYRLGLNITDTSDSANTSINNAFARFFQRDLRALFVCKNENVSSPPPSKRRGITTVLLPKCIADDSEKNGSDFHGGTMLDTELVKPVAYAAMIAVDRTSVPSVR
jgi:hypothetical protein